MKIVSKITIWLNITLIKIIIQVNLEMTIHMIYMQYRVYLHQINPKLLCKSLKI